MTTVRPDQVGRVGVVGAGVIGGGWALHFLRMIARAEMAADDHLVMEAGGALDEIVEMHVAELVNFLPAMIGPNETQLHNQHLGFEDGWIAIETGRVGVTGVSHERGAHLPRHRQAG